MTRPSSARPPGVALLRWQRMTPENRRALARAYWKSLPRETRQMLAQKYGVF